MPDKTDKLIGELNKELEDLSESISMLKKRKPKIGSDYTSSKKAWIEETVEFLASIKIDYYNW